MLLPVASFIVLGATPPQVSPLEALAVARWFAECVDVKTRSNQIHSRLDRHGWASTYGTPVYLVTFGKSGTTKFSFFVIVDSVSGHVVHADTFPRNDAKFPESRDLTDKWLKRLGLANQMRPSHLAGRYEYAVDGKPYLNLNGYTSAHFQTRGSEFAWYVAPGAMPPPPKSKPRIPAANAAVIGAASRKQKIPNWPEELEARTTLGPFFDEDAKATKWVWKVEEGNSRNGKFHAGFTAYVDAVTGKTISDQHIQRSRFMYKSFAPKSGLAKVKPVTLAYPILDLALRKVREIGRTELRFESVEIGAGARLKRDNDTELEVGSTGKLLSFKAPTEPGVLDQSRALPRGSRFIRAQTSSLPEGRFLAAKSKMGNFTRVFYRQMALGYEYLDSEVAHIDYNSKGTIASFKVNPPSPRPDRLPARVLQPGAIHAKAMAMSLPHVPKSTSTARYYATVRVGKLGWFVLRGTNGVRLVYRVDIWMMRDIKNWAVQGGGRSYSFDAETGDCLEKFP